MSKEQVKDNYPNLNRSNKWLGIIDYKSLIILFVILFLTWSILGLLIQNQIYRVYLLVIIAIPFLGLFYANKSSENISNVIYIVLKYMFSPKLYVYNIETNRKWLK
ncbi:MAG: hypothetical protein IJ272_00300 [Clostridia bacterium]|nr:hypothetical protein [Clostridia bacterium]